MQTSQTPATTPSPALVLALRRVLRPMVKLMLARGITYPYLADLLKALFVDVADNDFRLDQKPPTDSRVSLVSGVHRKEVNRLHQEMVSHAEIVPSVVSLGAQLVAVWLGSAQYLDENNRPRPLPRFVSEGGELSFEALVAGVNSFIRPRVVLDEWLRLGVARYDEAHRVCLNVEAFIPAKGFDEKAYYFGHNLHDHAAAATHNLIGAGKPFLERTVHYDALSASSVAALAAQSGPAGMEALLAVYKRAMRGPQRSRQPFYAHPCRRKTCAIPGRRWLIRPRPCHPVWAAPARRVTASSRGNPAALSVPASATALRALRAAPASSASSMSAASSCTAPALGWAT